MTKPSAPITTADMLTLLYNMREASLYKATMYSDETSRRKQAEEDATFRAILARLEQQEPPSAVVSVEALRALPRYEMWCDIHHAPSPESNPIGEWVKWSDLAALWPPQIGTET